MVLTGDEFRERCTALLGGAKLGERVALAFGLSRNSAFLAFRNGPQKQSEIILKFLEVAPQEYWPEEAKKARVIE